MNRLSSSSSLPGELSVENNISLRPSSFDSFIGQNRSIENIKVFLKAAKDRSEALDHVLIYGLPGLGKTTLANIIANEMDAGIKTSSGPALNKVGDLAAILTNLKQNDVLFIDEIHRLNKLVEESLYSAMEDFSLDIIIGEGSTARMLKIDIPRFTLVGATTRLGLLSKPFKDRFGILVSLEPYSPEELMTIISRYISKVGLSIDADAALEIARRSRGTPRIALRLLRRVRDFCSEHITLEQAIDGLNKLNIDPIGLDDLDIKYLKYIHHICKGGPVGIETIVAGISEDQATIEDVIEPYLLKIGFIKRTSRGRVLSPEGTNHIIIN